MGAQSGSYDRESEFETRSRDSWMKGFNNFDDVSMSSSTILSPGSSVKHLLQADEYEPEPINTNHFHHSSDTLKQSNGAKKSERSLTSFEHAILDSMASPSNISPQNKEQQQQQRQQQQQQYQHPMSYTSNLPLPNIYEDQINVRAGMPPPRARVASQKSNASMLSTGSSARPQLNEHKASSNVSMLSDLTDTS